MAGNSGKAGVAVEARAGPRTLSYCPGDAQRQCELVSGHGRTRAGVLGSGSQGWLGLQPQGSGYLCFCEPGESEASCG